MKKNVFNLFIIITFISILLPSAKVYAESIKFSDAGIENSIRIILSKPDGNITNDDLAHIKDLSLNNITNLSDLKYLTNLTSLDISDSPNLNDFSALNKLIYLKKLSLKNSIKDSSNIFNNLMGLNSLYNLNLSENNIVDITDIKKLPNLVELDLSKNEISNIESLKYLKRLVWLNLSNNDITNITALSNLNNLVQINLSSNNIQDINALSSLTDLADLNVENNKISDFYLLSKLIKLNEFKYNNNLSLPDANILNPIKIYINDTRVYTDVPPIIINERTFVPMRAIFEALCADIKWDDATSTITANKGDKEIKLVINSVIAYINGESYMMDIPPKIIDGRTMVPVRFISEALGANVNWDGNNRIVTITPQTGESYKGRMINEDGSVYDGEFIDYLYNGKGKLTDIQGDMYEGDFYKGEKSGKGKYTFCDGSVYEGEFKDNSITGNGTYTDKDGNVSEGYFENSQFDEEEGNKLTTTEIGKYVDAVVYIENTGYDGKISSGSGFIISSDGKLVTNYHVIDKAMSLEITFNDNKVYTGNIKVIAYDKFKDIAILKLDLDSLPFCKLGDSDKVNIGDEIVTIGSPIGLKNSLSNGIISSFRPGYIQISAPISHGSSGGTLFNMYGHVIGITSAIDEEGQNLGFAIPINEMKKLPQKKSLSLEELYKEVYNTTPVAIKASYEDYANYLYSTASSFSLDNGKYIINFDGIYIEETPEDTLINIDTLILIYYINKDNSEILLKAREDGYQNEIEHLFRQTADKMKKYYNKDVTGYIMRYGEFDDRTQFTENNIQDFNTYLYNNKTNKWDLYYPYLKVITNLANPYKWYKDLN